MSTQKEPVNIEEPYVKDQDASLALENEDDIEMSGMVENEASDPVPERPLDEGNEPDKTSSNDPDKTSSNDVPPEKISTDDENKTQEASTDKESVIEETDSKVSQPPSRLIPKNVSTFSMQLSKEDIERMISDGSLEKFSEGYYKVKSDSYKSIKSSLTSLNNPSVCQETPVIQLPTAISLQTLPTQITGPSVVQQPSFVALMPVNQVSGTTGNSAFVALPIQQTNPITYNPTLPAFVSVAQTSIPSISSAIPQIVTQANIPTISSATPQIVTQANIPTVSSATPQIVTQANIPTMSSATPHIVTRATESPPVTTSTDKEREVDAPLAKRKGNQTVTQGTSPILTTIQSKMITRETANISSSSTRMSANITTGLKRKTQMENTIRKPYRFAKPLRKRRKTSKFKDFVSDQNSSGDEDETALTYSSSYGVELSSMFFKKVGEPKTANKSLLDKLHNAIFNDSNVESDEEESEDSDSDDVISDIKSGKAKYKTLNCPGPSQYEALIGPANNSKLSIIRCQETKQVKNFLYEIYKVRVTSAGREANTNILIPIPDGYKFEIPQKPKEEEVEFSHIPHEDPESSNYVNPLFLEKLAETELKLRKCKDEIKVLRARYLELLQEYSNRPQFSTLSDLVGASAKFLTEDQLVFFLMQLKAGAHNMQGIRYSVREKVLALSIYQKSPEVYKWLKKLFNLPSKRNLDQWLEEIGSQDPQLLKKLMYHIYTTYNFKADI